MPKITPFLWFDGQLEEAIEFYTSIFEDSKVVNVSRHGEDETGQPGGVVTATFELAGQTFMGLNGGPQFKFTEAISLFVECEDQAEVDYYWDRLLDGGEESMCGWLKDRYGLSWQVIPKALGQLMGDLDQEKAGRVMQAMLQMKKIDVGGLQRAYEGY